jgi:hypothetical protein
MNDGINWTFGVSKQIKGEKAWKGKRGGKMKL